MDLRLEEDAVFLYALRSLKGMGPRLLLRLVRQFPDLSGLAEHSSSSELEAVLGSSLGTTLFQLFHQQPEQWQRRLGDARETLVRHLDQGILPLALTSDFYPPLLKLIADPPLLLYVKGNLALLRKTKAVAIVGTREPTPGGMFVAHHLALQLAKRDYTVVSGLAKGIDAKAHEGALEAKGHTIAVFGTPLDTIYPAVHRRLAAQILDEWGLLVSELALGEQGFSSSFVQRDRIQSGLSLAVLPIQTRNEGGTMHTVQFARTQHRLILCPQPLPAEAQAPQYEGIRTLIKEGDAQQYSFSVRHVNYSKLLALVQHKREELLPQSGESVHFELFSAFPYMPSPPSSQQPTPVEQTEAAMKRKRRQTAPLDIVQSPLM